MKRDAAAPVIPVVIVSRKPWPAALQPLCNGHRNYPEVGNHLITPTTFSPLHSLVPLTKLSPRCHGEVVQDYTTPSAISETAVPNCD